MSEDNQIEDDSLDEQIRFIVERAKTLHVFVERNIVSVILGQQQKAESENAIWATYSRMFLNLGDMSLATEAKHVQLACAGSRSMFEHLLDLKRLESTPTSAESFWDCTKVKRFDIAMNMLKFLDANPSVDQSGYQHHLTLAGDATKRDERDNLCRKHGWVTTTGKLQRPNHWWYVKVEDRAESAGIQYEEEFWDKYSVFSQYIHPGGAGIDHISAGAFKSLFFLAHAHAQEWFIKATEIASAQFHIFDATPGLGKQFRDEFRNDS